MAGTLIARELHKSHGAATILAGVSVTVAEMLDALEAVGGPEARARVVPRPDQRVMDIVCSWPGEFDVERTLSLGFRPDSSFEAAVRQFHREFVA